MSLIYTYQLNEANPFDYLTDAAAPTRRGFGSVPEQWMPWNYREALA